MKRPSLKVEKWMRETLTWLAREFPDSREDELAMHILYERIAKDPSESKMLFRCAVEPFWEEVAAEVRKPVDAVGPRKKKKAKRPGTAAAARPRRAPTAG